MLSAGQLYYLRSWILLKRKIIFISCIIENDANHIIMTLYRTDITTSPGNMSDFVLL